MSNWAIVIGIDQYRQPEHALQAAVSDALRMSDWLLAPDGGNVPPDQMRLLLSPALPREKPPNALPADRVSVITAINDVLRQSNGRGSRLFFYFAGHGMSARVDLANLSAILTSDFHVDFPDQSISLTSLFDHCQSVRFEEQFFIFDACRDIAFGQTEIRVGGIPRPNRPLTPPPPQYVMYATQSGARAIELREPGAKRGAFTTALLEGLAGKRSAKQWDPENEQYKVKWNSLFNFVRGEVVRLRLVAGSTPGGPIVQEPRTYGETDGKNPSLATLGQALVNNETIRINVQPPTLIGAATLQVRDMDDDHHAGPPVAQPHEFSLPPRRYKVIASAPGYAKANQYVDLYEPLEVTLELRPPGPTDPALMSADSTPRGARGIVFTHDIDAQQTGVPRTSVPVIVQSPDALTRVELIDDAGTVISGRRGRVSAEVGPGLYRSRVVSPEGRTYLEPFEVTGLEQRVLINVDLPGESTPAMAALMDLGPFDTKPDGTVDVSEAIGDAAFVQTSTLLALSAAATIEGLDNYGHRLRNLRLPSFPALTRKADSGVQVLLGNESARTDRWKLNFVRLIPQNGGPPGHERPAIQTEVPGIFASTHELAPGAYWLEVSTGGRPDYSMPLHVIPDHVALVVLMETRHGDFILSFFQVRTRDDENDASFDPQFPSCRFAAIRRIELMERWLAGGQITPMLPDLEEMLKLKWLDPVAGSLGCYALIRLGRFDDVKNLSDALLERFPGLPDPWIARASCADHANDADGRDYGYKRALALGCPSFREGINLLRRFFEGTDESQARAFDRFAQRIIPDSPWTANYGVLSQVWREVAKPDQPKAVNINTRQNTRSLTQA